LLALATSFRELTPYLAPFFLPLACCGDDRRLARMIATILPPLCVVVAMMAWNHVRIGWPVVTTTAEVNMVQPLFLLITQDLPVYAGDDAFDRAARETLTRPDFDEIAPMLQGLFQQENMTAPELAETATARYWRAWERFPLAMLWSSALRFQASFLKLPFAPVDTIAGLDVFSGQQPSPDLVKLIVLWHRTLAGDVDALTWLLLVVITRSVGMAVAFRWNDRPLARRPDVAAARPVAGCAAVPAVHMPVHLDTVPDAGRPVALHCRRGKRVASAPDRAHQNPQIEPYVAPAARVRAALERAAEPGHPARETHGDGCMGAHCKNPLLVRTSGHCSR
jgi:hypothetical protein